MTIEHLADEGAVARLVGTSPSPRWWNARLTLRGADGEDRVAFFHRPVPERIAIVRRAFLETAPWEAVCEIKIDKGAGKVGKRAICWGTVLDTARMYLISDWLVRAVERRLTDVAIAYRPQRSMTDSIRQVAQKVRGGKMYAVAVLDIEDFFGSLSWKQLDRVIDTLPASYEVRRLLHDVIRVPVKDVRTGRMINRVRGIPAGLVVSPVLANLMLAGTDNYLGRKLSKMGVMIRRYADDIAIFAPSMASLTQALRVVQHQIAVRGLRVKPGTGEPVDLREPGTSVRWLGIQFEMVQTKGGRAMALTLPDATIEAKVAELKAEMDAGVLNWNGAENRLEALGSFYRNILADGTVAEAITTIRNELDALDPTWGTAATANILRHEINNNVFTTRKENAEALDRLVHHGQLRRTAGNASTASPLTGNGQRTPGDDFRWSPIGQPDDLLPEDAVLEVVRHGSGDDLLDGHEGEGAEGCREGSTSLTLPSPAAAGGTTGTPTGAPAGSPPFGGNEPTVWRVSVTREGAGRVLATAVSATGTMTYTATATGTGPAATINAFLGVLPQLPPDDEVELHVTEPTLRGYVREGWRNRSLGVRDALAELRDATRGRQIALVTQ